MRWPHDHQAALHMCEAHCGNEFPALVGDVAGSPFGETRDRVSLNEWRRAVGEQLFAAAKHETSARGVRIGGV